MRRAGRIVADVLAAVEEELRPGVTTAMLDTVAENYIRRPGRGPRSRVIGAFRPASAFRLTPRWSTGSLATG